MSKQWTAFALGIAALAAGLTTVPHQALAWPSFAAAEPLARDSSGKIVCANCHLKEGPVQIEFPQSVLPGEVFEIKIHVPYDVKQQQVGADGSPAPMQMGAYIQIPKGFKLAEESKLTKEQKEHLEKQGGVQPLYPDKPERANEFIINQIDGSGVPNQEFIVPVQAPDPNAQGSEVRFGKYGVYVGANRGRGQVYSNGVASNNAEYTAPVKGKITKVETGQTFVNKLQYGRGTEPADFEYTGGTQVTIADEKGKPTVLEIPPGPKLLAGIAQGTDVKAGQPLTTNPNVGGYGAGEKDVVLQDPQRVAWLIAFLGAAFVCQLLLVLKKKQIVKVQEYEAQQQGL